MVTLAADISLLAGPSGLQLEVAPSSLFYKNEKNSCNQFIDNPVINFLVGINMVIYFYWSVVINQDIVYEIIIYKYQFVSRIIAQI